MSGTGSSRAVEQESKREIEQNWSEKVEDLVESGAVDGAISFIEAQISKLESLSSPNSELRLASVLGVLAGLYDSKGLSFKANEARSFAFAIKKESLRSPPLPLHGLKDARKESEEGGSSGEGDLPQSSLTKEDSEDEKGCLGTHSDSADVDQQPGGASSDDDWEAKADLEPDQLLPPQLVQKLKEISLEDTVKEVPKRRGRGNFSYMKHGLYSDQLSEESDSYEDQDKVDNNHQENLEVKDSAYGTHHVLVLDGFRSSTTTTDLENLLECFKDRDFSICWVSDTVALAVFRTPSDANDACRTLRFPCSVRVLEEDDSIMKSISVKDLEPPKRRPKTSAQAAQRLIARGMGIKIPSPTFGSRELRKQEEERRNRIIARQDMKDDAWGPDD